MTIRRAALGAACSLALLAGSGAIATSATADHVKVDRVVIKGDVTDKLKLSAADLAALPQVTETLTFLQGTTPQTHTYTGPLLLDVLNLATPEFDPAIKNDNLGHFVVVTGSDGYKVAVAWGEFDPGFEAKKVVVALSQDGVALGDAGPRLVMPGDSKGGRYVSDVVSIKLAPAN